MFAARTLPTILYMFIVLLLNMKHASSTLVEDCRSDQMHGVDYWAVSPLDLDKYTSVMPK